MTKDANRSGRTVLVVDDSSFARRHSRALLEALDFVVREAVSGKAALDYCATSLPDLVMLDLVMDAGQDGIETLIALRAAHPALKVVIVSADIQQGTQQRAKEEGAAGYITKPMTAAMLGATLGRVLADPSVLPIPPILQHGLMELMNIGYGRAANALSIMTKDRVLLEPPQLYFLPIDDVTRRLAQHFGAELIAVNQVFAGPIGGSAMLVVDREAAMLLTELVDSTIVSTEFDRDRQDIITELGNVLLNACLGALGNILSVQVSFAVPRLQMEDIARLLNSVVSAHGELTHALVIQSSFTLRKSGLSGFFLMVLGIASVDKILAELERQQNVPGYKV